MTDPQRKLQSVARTTANILFPLAVMVCGLSLRALSGLDRYEGTAFILALTGTLVQAVFLPLAIIVLGLGLRRAVADAVKAADYQ